MDFPKITKAKLLVVDDDPDILSALQMGLAIPGTELEVITAKNGMTGLQLAKKELPDVIVLDLQMPDISGFEVIDELRQDPQLKSTRVIMLTAQDTGYNLWESIDRQFDDFIGKPFELDELEARIYNQLLHRAEQSANQGIDNAKS